MGSVMPLWPTRRQIELSAEYMRRVEENEGKPSPVNLYEVFGANADAPRLAVLRDRSPIRVSALSRAIAFASSSDFILGAAYGGIFGMLAVLVPAIITAWWVR